MSLDSVINSSSLPVNDRGSTGEDAAVSNPANKNSTIAAPKELTKEEEKKQKSYFKRALFNATQNALGGKDYFGDQNKIKLSLVDFSKKADQFVLKAY